MLHVETLSNKSFKIHEQKLIKLQKRNRQILNYGWISNIPVTANERGKISKGTEDTNSAINQAD